MIAPEGFPQGPEGGNLQDDADRKQNDERDSVVTVRTFDGVRASRRGRVARTARLARSSFIGQRLVFASVEDTKRGTAVEGR